MDPDLLHLFLHTICIYEATLFSIQENFCKCKGLPAAVHEKIVARYINNCKCIYSVYVYMFTSKNASLKIVYNVASEIYVQSGLAYFVLAKLFPIILIHVPAS